MAKRRKKRSKKKQEQDSVFFMKVLFYFLLGAMWVRLIDIGSNGEDISLPLGLVVGVVFAHHDHFTIDKKIEFAILIIAAALSFYLPVGILV